MGLFRRDVRARDVRPCALVRFSLPSFFFFFSFPGAESIDYSLRDSGQRVVAIRGDYEGEQEPSRVAVDR